MRAYRKVLKKQNSSISSDELESDDDGNTIRNQGLSLKKSNSSFGHYKFSEKYRKSGEEKNMSRSQDNGGFGTEKRTGTG